MKWEQECYRLGVKRRQGENWWVTQSKGMCSWCFAYAQNIIAKIQNPFMMNTHQIFVTVFAPLWTKAFIPQLVCYFYFFPLQSASTPNHHRNVNDVELQEVSSLFPEYEFQSGPTCDFCIQRQCNVHFSC